MSYTVFNTNKLDYGIYIQLTSHSAHLYLANYFASTTKLEINNRIANLAGMFIAGYAA